MTVSGSVAFVSYGVAFWVFILPFVAIPGACAGWFFGWYGARRWIIFIAAAVFPLAIGIYDYVRLDDEDGLLLHDSSLLQVMLIPPILFAILAGYYAQKFWARRKLAKRLPG